MENPGLTSRFYKTSWSQLVDRAAWLQRHKHCSDVSMLRGSSRLNSQSEFRFETLGFYFEPEIVTFEPHRILVWSAKGPAATNGSHALYIEPSLRGYRVITEESQIGLFLFFLQARPRDRLLRSHEEWLRSLKKCEEARRDSIFYHREQLRGNL